MAQSVPQCQRARLLGTGRTSWVWHLIQKKKMLFLTLRFITPFPNKITTNIVKTYEEFRAIPNVNALRIHASGGDICYRVGTIMTFENDTTSEVLYGYGLDLESACKASAAHALGEYVRLGG